MKILIAAALAATAGCSPTESTEVAVGNDAAPAQSAEAGAAAPPAATPKAAPVSTKIENAVIEFEYAYPGEAAAIPALKAALDKDSADQRKRTEAEATDDKTATEADGFPYRKHSFAKTWKVSADTPALLAMAGEGYAYTGGAHGNPFYETIFWDRAAGKTVELETIVSDRAKLDAVLTPAFCKALDAERAKRRAGQEGGDAPSSFTDCPQLGELPVALVGANGRIERLQVIVGPYLAGPYSEGTYDIDLPVTTAIRALVRPAYAAAFAPG